jgi:acyl-CoA-binding protein
LMEDRTRLEITEADTPQGKAKYNKWQEQVNAGLSQKDAEAKYIELGNELLKKHDN